MARLPGNEGCVLGFVHALWRSGVAEIPRKQEPVVVFSQARRLMPNVNYQEAYPVDHLKFVSDALTYRFEVLDVRFRYSEGLFPAREGSNETVFKQEIRMETLDQISLNKLRVRLKGTREILKLTSSQDVMSSFLTRMGVHIPPKELNNIVSEVVQTMAKIA